MNQKTSKVEKEFYLRCSYLTLSVLFDKEPTFHQHLHLSIKNLAIGLKMVITSFLTT